MLPVQLPPEIVTVRFVISTNRTIPKPVLFKSFITDCFVTSTDRTVPKH